MTRWLLQNRYVQCEFVRPLDDKDLRLIAGQGRAPIPPPREEVADSKTGGFYASAPNRSIAGREARVGGLNKRERGHGA